MLTMLPDWQQSKPLCDLIFVLTMDDRSLSGEEQAVINFSKEDGLIRIYNERNFTTAGEDWTLVITAQSYKSFST